MEDRLSPKSANTRRANRIVWERPVLIVNPVRASGKTINVSAVGILLSTDRHLNLPLGAEIALSIPHMEGRDSMVVHGRVVRVERTTQDMRVAVNFS
ncbi:MAG: PilZ domain-containing protein [Chloroflexota bacterium]